jgi:NAD dependent epimerase/dehydratase family enzyme
MADALLLASQRAKPEFLLKAGFSFRHEELEPALRDVLLR